VLFSPVRIFLGSQVAGAELVLPDEVVMVPRLAQLTLLGEVVHEAEVHVTIIDLCGPSEADQKDEKSHLEVI
jgi:hypothetical protein